MAGVNPPSGDLEASVVTASCQFVSMHSELEGSPCVLVSNKVFRSPDRSVSFENRLMGYFCHFSLYTFDFNI